MQRRAGQSDDVENHDHEKDGSGPGDRGQDGKACPEGEAQLKQLAERRAVAVRDYLLGQGGVDATRVTAATADVFAPPRQKGEAQARVEFARGTD